MTHDEALDITLMVASRWPGNWATEDTLAAYAQDIQNLDVELTMKAVLRCVNELEFYPKVSVLRQYVAMEKRQQEYALTREEAVEAQRMPHKVPRTPRLPEWVKGWAVSRYRYNDFRTWPAQDPDDFSVDPMPKEMQEKYMVEGAGLTIEMMFRPIGLEL